MNIYFRNDAEGTYFKAEVDPKTKVIKSPIHDWQPDPPCQIIRRPGNVLVAAHGGGDMPGWLVRLIRKYGYGVTQTELGAACGVTAPTISYYENSKQPIPHWALPKLYNAMRIDHHPAEPTPELLRKVKKFLGFKWRHMAMYLGVADTTLEGYVIGKRTMNLDARNRFYALYCMLPDLTKEKPPRFNSSGASQRNDT
jgi:transcriptional regulator with XRE-family HTH domain